MFWDSDPPKFGGWEEIKGILFMHPVSPCVVCGFLGQLEALGLVSFDLKELCHFIAIQVLSFFMYIVAKKDPEASNRDFFLV